MARIPGRSAGDAIRERRVHRPHGPKAHLANADDIQDLGKQKVKRVGQVAPAMGRLDGIPGGRHPGVGCGPCHGGGG